MFKKIKNVAFLLLIFSCALVSACNTAAPKLPHAVDFPLAWIALSGSQSALIRTLPIAGTCPIAKVDGQEIKFKPRPNIPPGFMETCELARDKPWKTLIINGQKLPVVPKHPRRIVIVGDTGCRIKAAKDGSVVAQNCNDESEWPFHLIAKAATAWNPDLVIHVGDYHYREAPCPNGNKGCEGADSGDTWSSWAQDFFSPAAPLLRKAPWVFVRGNHELCRNGGYGWSNSLDPRPSQSQCQDTSPPYLISFENIRLAVIDSAKAENINPSFELIETKKKAPPLWVLVHRPFQAAQADDESAVETKLPPRLSKPGKVAMILTGHRHFMRLTTFDDARPPEIISGNSGDRLDRQLPQFPGEKSTTLNQFGFSTLEEIGVDIWELNARDVYGRALLTWTLEFSSDKVTKVIVKSSAERTH